MEKNEEIRQNETSEIPVLPFIRFHQHFWLFDFPHFSSLLPSETLIMHSEYYVCVSLCGKRRTKRGSEEWMKKGYEACNRIIQILYVLVSVGENSRCTEAGFCCFSTV